MSIETPTKGRGSVSKMTVSPMARSLAPPDQRDVPDVTAPGPPSPRAKTVTTSFCSCRIVPPSLASRFGMFSHRKRERLTCWHALQSCRYRPPGGYWFVFTLGAEQCWPRRGVNELEIELVHRDPGVPAAMGQLYKASHTLLHSADTALLPPSCPTPEMAVVG